MWSKPTGSASLTARSTAATRGWWFVSMTCSGIRHERSARCTLVHGRWSQAGWFVGSRFRHPGGSPHSCGSGDAAAASPSRQPPVRHHHRARLDLGFSNEESEHLLVRADLLIQLQKAIASKGLKQAEAARVLRVTQPRVSDLLRGRIDLFSTDALIDMLARLGVGVRLVVKSARSREVAQDPVQGCLRPTFHCRCRHRDPCLNTHRLLRLGSARNGSSIPLRDHVGRRQPAR
jgi:predicted XRE-type DNA-binding protein